MAPVQQLRAAPQPRAISASASRPAVKDDGDDWQEF